MENNKDFDLIEKYLSNQLSDTEKQSFDNRVAEDERFAEELERQQSAHKALDFLVAENLKAQLQDMEAESKIISLKKRRRTRLTVLSLAASVLVLIGAFWIVFPQDSMSNAELAALYYETPDYGTRGANDEVAEANSLHAGINALQNNQLEDAITQLGDVEASDPEYLVAQYYLGHAYYAAGQFDQAGQSFARVSSSNDLRYVEEAQWYELLSCLSQDAECKELLNRLLGEESHAFYTKAEEISQRSK